MFFVRQKKGYGIGNFINLTPTIKTLSEIRNEVISVYFEQPEIEVMYKGCSFIKPITKSQTKGSKPVLCSSSINQHVPDWVYNHNKIFGADKKIPHTYVPIYNTRTSYKDCVVLIRNMVNDNWKEKKDPGDKIYKEVIEILESRNKRIVFVGTTLDYNRFYSYMQKWCKKKPILIMDNIIESLASIKNCDYVVSNDTGMYHVAGAYNKDQFTFWKDTNIVKNQNPSAYTHYGFVKDHYKESENHPIEDFEKWLYRFELKK